jgi:hypothetical protein
VRCQRFAAAAAALAGVCLAGYVVAAGFAAPLHQSGCHSQHTCPSDHATYVWTDGNGRGWLCVEPGASEYDSSFSTTIVYAGLTYYCKTSGSPPPPPTTTATTTTAATTTADTTTAETTTEATTTTAAVTTAASTEATTTAPISPSSPPGVVTTSKAPTVSLTLHTPSRTIGCAVRGPLQDSRCTPGAVFVGITKADVCAPGYAGRVRNVPESLKRRVYTEYGLGAHHGAFEVDHLVSLELGGSNVEANLWPEAALPRPGFHDKDRLENRLHAMVCSGTLSLQAAQNGIARNWLPLYRQEFGGSLGLR